MKRWSLLVCLIVIVFLIWLISFIRAEIIHDVDNDEIPSNIDNCPLDYNPLQEDSNHNGIGDICDPTATVIIPGPVIIIPNKTIPPKPPCCETCETCKHTTEIDFTQFCEMNWQCSAWSSCNNGVMRRTCIDTNHCDFSYNKPVETMACEQNVLASALSGSGKTDYSSFMMFISLGITLLLLIILIVLSLIR